MMEKNEYRIVERIVYNSSVCINRVRKGDETFIVKFVSPNKEQQEDNTIQNESAKNLFQEYSVGSSVSSPYVANFIAFQRFDFGYGIIMNDIAGQSLKDFLISEKCDDGIDIDLFLDIAIKITQGVGAIHSAGVIHKDINSHNIIINKTTKEINIIDFGISSQLAKKEVSPSAILPTDDKNKLNNNNNNNDNNNNHNVFVEGTLSYMSPEQTGRMNRFVDYRSDFYSLGATFYELLTGKPPFIESKNSSPLDIVYKHIAVHPSRIHKVRPVVGEAISALVAKLMAKNAEDRYQNHEWLLHDLTEIKRQWPTVSPNFIIGKRDQSITLQISQKLYGREREVKSLKDNFEHVCTLGTTSAVLMLVHGPSGVGKTALVNEVHKPSVRQHGYFCSGKFNQFMTASPYTAIVQAISSLIKQLLGSSEKYLSELRTKLCAELGNDGKILTDLLPELELLIGKQPDIAHLDAVENMHRLRRVFSWFIFALASKEHPVVIFLDDLQWADTNTLGLLVLLLCSDEAYKARHLLIVGAYRDNEVNADHVLIHTLQEITKKGGHIDDVKLVDLKPNDVVRLVDDTFNSKLDASTPKTIDSELLGKLIFQKTQGNPFFVNQFLTTLYKEKQIYYNFNSSNDGEVVETRWECDIEAVKAANYTRNVVDLMVASLSRRLDDQTQQIMGVAAMIGYIFDLELVSQTCGVNVIDVSTLLSTAIQEGFVAPLGKYRLPASLKLSTGTISNISDTEHIVFKFEHDRVQQASLLLLGNTKKLEMHRILAEKLLTRCVHALKRDGRVGNEDFFSIVNHANQGFHDYSLSYPSFSTTKDNTPISMELSLLPFTVVSLAELNLLAAHKAKLATAFKQSMSYCDTATHLLSQNKEKAWSSQKGLMWQIEKCRAELAVSLNQLDITDKICSELLERVESVAEKFDIYCILQSRHEVVGQLSEALAITFKALLLYGVEIHMDQAEEQFTILYDQLSQKMAPYTDLTNYFDLPQWVDRRQADIARMLMKAWAVAYLSGNVKLADCISHSVILRSLEYGHFPETGLAMVACATSRMKADIHTLQIAQIGLKLLHTKYTHRTDIRGPAEHIFGVGVSIWYFHLSECLKHIELAFELNKQAGNTTYMSYSGPYLFEYPLLIGNLKEAERIYNKTLPFWKEGNYGFFPIMEGTAQPLWDELGIKKHFLKGQTYEESYFSKVPYMQSVYFNSSVTTMLFLRTDPHNWLEHSDEAIRVSPGFCKGLFREPDSEVMGALLYLAWLGQSPLAAELYNERENRDVNSYPCEKIKGDENLSHDEQIAKLQQRVQQVKIIIEHVTQWASVCSANYEFRKLLILAEAARVACSFGSMRIWQGVSVLENKIDFESITLLYEQAIASADRNSYQNYKALGNELYARFLLSRGKKRFGALTMLDALEIYESAGFAPKVTMLQEEFGDILSDLGVIKASKQLTKQKSKSTPVVSSLDLQAIIVATQTISNEVDIDTLVLKMVKTMVEAAGAERGIFFMTVGDDKHEQTLTYAECTLDQNEDDEVVLKASMLKPQKEIEQWLNGPTSVVQFVSNRRQAVVLECAFESDFMKDEYIFHHQVKSVMCLPIMLNNQLKGVMYLENNIITGLYDKTRVEIFNVLTSQMAISLANHQFLQEQLAMEAEKIRMENHKQEEEQRIRAETAEQYKDQLENFIDMICHEIRNPLNGIFGNTDMIYEYLRDLEQKIRPNDNDDETSEKALLKNILISAQSIQVCAEHQKCMADDVLQMSQLRSHKLSLNNSPFKPCNMLQTMSNIYKPQADAKGLDLNINMINVEESDVLIGDMTRIFQIATNFISNAVKFTEKGSVAVTLKINVNTEKSQSIPNITTVATCELEIKVSDTGIGLSQTEITKLFKRFSQSNNRTNKQYGGSGLGLAICKKLAKLMNGTITVESEENKGSTFTLRLPSHLQLNPTSSNKLNEEDKVKTQADKDEKQARNILIVEDNIMNQTILSRVLKAKGFIVDIANNGSEGLLKFKDHQKQNNNSKNDKILHYLCILMDVQMPVMDGLEATKKIREFEIEERLPRVSIIGLSGNAQSKYKDSAIEVGMDNYITKPYHKETLYAILETL